MEYAPKSLTDLAGGVLRRPLIVLGILLLCASVGAWFALTLPPLYRSSATILIEQQEIPQDLVRSTVTSYADERIQVISQRVMTTQNLMEIIKKYGLYAKELAEKPREVVLNDMRRAIRMDRISADVTDPRTGSPKKATVAFNLSFSSNSAEQAQRVANELVSLYLQENLKTRTASAEEAASFLAQEADRLRQQMAQVDERISKFKQEHQGELPDDPGTSPLALERVNTQMLDVGQRLRSLEERELALTNQLRQLEAIYADRAPEEAMLLDSRGNRIMPPKDRLKGLEVELKSLLSRYAATHPDVVRVQKEVDALRKELASTADAPDDPELAALRGRLAGLKERYSAAHPDVKRLEADIAQRTEQLAAEAAGKDKSPANDMDKVPAIVELKTQLGVIALEKAAAREEKARLQQQLATTEDRLARAPQIEKQMAAMFQERMGLQQSLVDLARRESEARLGESLEAERKGEKLTLIEPPTLPERPASPNRMAIGVMGLAIGLVLGLGLAVGLEILDHRIRGARVVAALLSAPPLGLIPPIVTPQDLARRRQRLVASGVGAFATVVLVLAGVHFLFRPLGVLWEQVLFRLGA
jgi:uncharacterized protein involved in exopolysaccharide biosynthesis